MSDMSKRCVLFMTFRPSQRTLFMARRNWVPLALSFSDAHCLPKCSRVYRCQTIFHFLCEYHNKSVIYEFLSFDYIYGRTEVVQNTWPTSD